MGHPLDDTLRAVGMYTAQPLAVGHEATSTGKEPFFPIPQQSVPGTSASSNLAKTGCKSRVVRLTHGTPAVMPAQAAF